MLHPRVRLPAKLSSDRYSLWLVSCSFLLSRKLFSSTLCLKAVDTIGLLKMVMSEKTSIGNEQWGEVGSIKHCEKRLSLKKEVIFSNLISRPQV